MRASKSSQHKVDITVTLESAITAEEQTNQGESQRKRILSQSAETSKPQRFFHYEYRLLPGDVELVKADVITYGKNAKVYTDTDSKVLKTWREGELVYFAWSQSRKIDVTKDLLLLLFNHTLELHIWDNKDKVSPRARFDRPKGFKSGQLPGRETTPDVTHSTTHDFNQQSPLPMLTKTKTTKSKLHMLGPPEGYIPSPPSPSSFQTTHLPFDRHGSISRGDRSFTPDSIGSDTGQKDQRKSRRQMRSKRGEQSNVTKQEIAILTLPMAQLFSGQSEISVQLNGPSAELRDAKIKVSISGPLMSEKQNLELNPISVIVRGATRMPKEPIVYDELRQRCIPAYCSYKFFKQREHKTCSHPQNINILWEDTSVILLGTLDKALIVEWLRGPPFVVEVHDRDRKYEDLKRRPEVFGKLTYDDKIGSLDLIAGRQAPHNPYKGPLKPWDPFGIAKFDLSELLHGASLLCLSSPIIQCSRPNLNDEVLVDFHSGDPNASPMPAGHYLESGSELKLKIKLDHPLISTLATPTITKSVTSTTPHCPYGRMIYIFPCQEKSLLNDLISKVTSINAAAFGFGDLPKEVAELALSTYKLSSEQKLDKQLDIITGFQVDDGKNHIFILEGLATRGIQAIWTRIHHPDCNATGTALYSSEMAFSERLYANLDVDLCQVRLHEPISHIVSQPLLYVRGMIPKLCYDALTILDKITQSTTLAEVSRNELYPTSEMIIALNREFGILPVKTADTLQTKETTSDQDKEDNPTCAKKPKDVKTSRTWTPIDNQNESYLQILTERSQNSPPDYVKINSLKVDAGQTKRRKKHIRSYSENATVAHNYSTQTLNSTVQAMNRLRQSLDKKDLYTYCKDFHSMTLAHDNLDKTLDSNQRKSWQTAQGFIYPGVKTSLESNAYPVGLDRARIDELTEPWEENILHANKLKPTVDRMRFSWPQRRQDMELWRKPPGLFDLLPLGTLDEYTDPKPERGTENKLPNFKTHRLSSHTEQITQGPHSSNQLEKLKGILKDLPNRQWMKESVMPDIPPFTVIRGNTYSNEKERWRGFYPGPLEGLSWSLPGNSVPIHDRQDDKFKERTGNYWRQYYSTHSPLHKRRIVQLTEEEIHTHLFHTVKEAVPLADN
ncbi:uncharacterized protein LOC134197472 isoform X2 [Corticium candelabrum]|uniref:uncharacterized protein LOC134197472 isoform X2 n=1 Tax=Corticium candelabrum TaxID=121492 RepID=UPI002E2643EC|nr:uncharacterized protein LOC134197472 isoform X2 [Corticium candelabrum]